MPVASIQYPDDIVNRNNNGGWHRNGKRAYRKAVQGILRFLQTAKEPRLYHLCFEPLADDISPLTSREMYKANMAMLHALVEMAERKGIRCEWWAAREIADGSKKDHIHAFMVIDAKGIRVAELFNQFEDGRVQQHCKAHGVKFAIFRPKDMDGIHGNNRYMALPYQGPGNRQTAEAQERLADALVWLSYLGKKRSKPEDDKSGQIYPASRPGRKAAPQAAQDPLNAQAATQTVPSSPVDLSTRKGNQTHTEKASNEGITTPQCGTEGQSTGQGHTSTTESLYSSSSSTLGSTGPRPRVPCASASTGTEDQATRPGQEHGGAGSSRGQTHQPVTPLPGAAQNFLHSYLDPLPTTGGTTVLTPAQNYIASRYEEAIGQQLDLNAVRAYLLAHGIKRTPAQVVHDLDDVYGFYGYASSHPAPAHVSTAVLDKIIDRMPDRDIKLLPIPTAWPYGRAEPRLIRVCPTKPMKLSHKVGSLGLTVCEPPFIIEPSTLLNQARSQA
jgi:hypothetical protein